jgi:hypothetical protein
VRPAGNDYASPSPPVTVTLYANPNATPSNTVFVLLYVPGTVPDATAGQVANDVIFNDSSGYVATGATSNSNGFTFSASLPGGITVVPPTLTLGQTFVPYAGLTATVTNVGTVPGSGACPTPNAIGATISYSFGSTTEIASFVPGCGVTDVVSDNGTEFRLKSIGSYPQLGTLSARRQTLSAAAISALRQTWRSVFTPWRPNR